MIISGGLNVYPKEIEALIDDFPEVEESAVIGIPHPDFGEAVAAVVTLKPDAAIDEEEVGARLRGVLASFKRPKAVFFTRELPRNAMGKVQKAALREAHRHHFE
jgi:malonyl-CoA/methylmalonyl-CoA synthetase